MSKLGSQADQQIVDGYRKAGWRIASAGTRSPLIAPITRFLLGLPLILVPAQTDEWFAWTIAVPLTALWLGACYWSGALLALIASRRPLWVQTRVSVYVAVVFAPLVTAATFIHLELFHTSEPIGIAWVAAYGLYTPLLAWVVWRQLREAGGDPPRERLLPLAVRAVLWTQALLMLPLGLAMFALPSEFSSGGAESLWPWPLTDLTSQVIGAWLLAFGVYAATLAWENDQNRVAPYLMAFPMLSALAAIGLLRDPGSVEWDEAAAYILLAYLASIVAVAAYSWLVARHAPEPDPGLGGVEGERDPAAGAQ